MNLTPFKYEIIDSLLWQIKGFKEGEVSERATNRILRASLRRIKPRLIGCTKVTATNNDHDVPVKVIVQLLPGTQDLSKISVIDILGKFYTSGS